MARCIDVPVTHMLISSERTPRIFWLGAHKLLVNTELVRLRQLGYEVFNPPYLSHVRDQSAVTLWDRDQPSTLPPDIFERLATYNFFYATIDPEIADILNQYFDAVVVTISAWWTGEILRVYEGPVIFRSYGQTSLLSSDLEVVGADKLVRSRTNFHFLPHAQETGHAEAMWLQERMTVVPYCLPPEVFQSHGTWVPDARDDRPILITAPNILGNPFHRAHYNYLKEFFYQSHFRFMGVQPFDRIEDPQVAGTLARDEQLKLFQTAAGYLYTYRDPRVCYLPPVEMMIIGGPVVYLSGSLLSRYIGSGGPGEAATVMIAHEKCARLRDPREAIFIEEIRDSQRVVAEKYDPEHVWPVFDSVMTKLLPAKGLSRPAAITPVNVFPHISPEWRKLRKAVQTFIAEISPRSGDSPGLEDNEVSPKSKADLVRELSGLQIPIGRIGHADVAQRDNLLHNGHRLGIGTWTYDPVVGRQASFVPAGTAGPVQYGPYIELAPGTYEVSFTYRQDSARQGIGEVPAGFVDINCDMDQIVTAEEIIPRSGVLQVSQLIFAVTELGHKYEFRVHSNGSSDIYLHGVTLRPVSPNRLIYLQNSIDLMKCGQHDLGYWQWDAVLEHISWYAPAGSAGKVHSSIIPSVDPGCYEMKCVLRIAGDTSEHAGTLEVLNMSGDRIFALNFSGLSDRPQLLRNVIKVDEHFGSLEFGIFMGGNAGIYLHSVILQKTDNETPQSTSVTVGRAADVVAL